MNQLLQVQRVEVREIISPAVMYDRSIKLASDNLLCVSNRCPDGELNRPIMTRIGLERR
jgi:hypothetical protein